MLETIETILNIVLSAGCVIFLCYALYKGGSSAAIKVLKVDEASRALQGIEESCFDLKLLGVAKEKELLEMKEKVKELEEALGRLKSWKKKVVRILEVVELAHAKGGDK